MNKNWSTISTKMIYSDPWIRLRIDTVEKPNGQGPYSVVELKGGIGVIPITEDKKIVIVGQYRYAPNVYSWEIPKGGFPEFGYLQSPLTWAKEELEEETGITAKTWEPLPYVHTLLGSTNDKVYLFIAQDLIQGKPQPDGTEDIQIKTVSCEEFFTMVYKQEITDATSIAAVALTARMQKKL